MEVTRLLNDYAFLGCLWAPEFSDFRKSNVSTLRIRRVANALAVLRDELPEVLGESRAVNPNADLGLTEALLDLVRKHRPLIEGHRPVRGRPRELAGNVAANIGKLVVKLCGSNSLTKKAQDAFVAGAMEWLSQQARPDTSISRNRLRRAAPLGSRRIGQRN
jgi:hypothetical protein